MDGLMDEIIIIPPAADELTIGLGQGGAMGPSGVINVNSPIVNTGSLTSAILSLNSSSANTPSYVVQRDASGNFSASVITANLVGNVTGNLVGNVTGNVSGSSGSTTGNAATANLATQAVNLSGTQTAKFVYAAPNEINGTASFRALIASDIPTLNQSTTGNASTATKLAASKNINGVAFDGSTDITVTAAAGTLTGSTLNSSVTGSSLTSVGIIGTGTWRGTTIGVLYGGTGTTTSTGTGSVVLSDSPTFTTAVTLPSNTSIGTTTSTELSYVHGVTSAIQSQIDSKIAKAGGTFTGAVTVSDTTQATSYSTGSLILSGGLGIAKNLYVQGNVDITGNININGQITGSLTEINVTNLNVSDSLIYLADGNLTSDAIDIGFYGAYRPAGDTSGHKHTGLIRDHNDSGIWKLVSGGPESDSNDVDFGLNDVNVNFDKLKLRSLIVTDASTTRTNLGLAIGTNVQSWDADLDAIAALTGTTGFLTKTAANTWALDTSTYLTSASNLAWNKIQNTPTTLAGYGITDAQALNSKLTGISSSTLSAGFLKYDGSSWGYDNQVYDTIVSASAPSTTANVFWVDTNSTNTIASIFGGTP
jgi:hypothetical protein